MRFRNPAGHRGLLGTLFGTLNALIAFFESRFELFAQESKSALVNIVVLVGCVAVAALFCGIGFVFLLVGAIAGLAHALQVSWIWIAVAVALLLFVLALGLRNYRAQPNEETNVPRHGRRTKER